MGLEFRKALEEACGLGTIVSSADGDTEVQRGRTAGEGPQERSPYALEPHTVSSLPRGGIGLGERGPRVPPRDAAVGFDPFRHRCR